VLRVIRTVFDFLIFPPCKRACCSNFIL